MSRALVAALVVAWVALTPGVATADPPGPTDYRTTVVSIDPPSPSVHPSIIGGDSFFQLRVDPGARVDVVGYRGEPFLQFLPDGEVRENRASLTYRTSQDRYGAEEPDDVGPDAEPEWRTVATDGQHAWHDHRTHWMSDFRPPGRQPGDVILEAAVPLVVDGRPTTVTVRSTWLPEPSPAPAWLGAGVGVAVGGAVVARRRSARTTAAVAALVGVVASGIGAWQFVSVPSETGPSRSAVALPAVAAAAAVVGMLLRRAPLAAAVTALAGVELVLWAWLRRDHLTAAVLPTDAPFWLDRAATSATLAAAAVLTAVAVHRSIVRPMRPASRQPLERRGSAPDP